MTAVNFLAYAAQVTCIVVLCAGLPRLLRLRSPAVQYVFWRALLVVCLALPIVQPWQPWQPGVMTFVPAPDHGPLTLSAAPPAPHTPAPARPFPTFDWVATSRIVIVGGIVSRLVWLGLGMLRLRRMRRRATDAAAGFEDLQEAIGATVSILWSSDVRHPVTFGVLQPVILLPVALRTADAPAQRAVVAHELHHAKRRDWGWVVAEEVIRSAFWFHPAIWWLVSRIQLARETVVDELSILVTNARRTYLDTLLAFADDTGFASSPAFSARRHLFHRVMLLSKEGEMSSIRVAVASFVLVLALGAGAWTAVHAFPLYGETQDQRPPRDPLTPEAHHRLAQQYWQKANADTSLTPEQRLDAILKGIAAEDRALTMNPDYVPSLTYKNIFLRMQANLATAPEERATLLRQADELRDKAIALQPPPARAPSTSPGVPPASTEFQAMVDQLKLLRVGGNIKTPMKVRDVKPVYPPEAQVNRVQGVVILETILDSNGRVAAARILRSIPLLDQAALEAVKQWEFTPTLLNGTPTAILMTVTVNFSLQ